MTENPISTRPHAKAKISPWTDKETGEITLGVALMARRGLAAHFTATEARAMADQLHDLSDVLDAHQATGNHLSVTTQSAVTANSSERTTP